jgi:hypothetical protein
MSASKKLLELVIGLMTDASNMKGMNGHQKKKYVIIRIKQELELPDAIEELIAEFIDMIIEVEKGKIKINKKEVKKAFLNIICC